MKHRGQGIVKVSNLFEKYKRVLRAPQKTVITEFVTAVRSILGEVPLSERQCAYAPRTRTLTLTVPGMLKTEILLQKREILKKMSATLGEKNAPHEIL